MRISDWSSDVCSSDLLADPPLRRSRRPPCARRQLQTRSAGQTEGPARAYRAGRGRCQGSVAHRRDDQRARTPREARKSVEWGKGVSVRVELGGRRSIKTKMKKSTSSGVSHEN